ncbi:putative ribosomal protein S18 [Oesophagostomum dentatum]|uniref:Putative ribosomal protein S18 n=1 Tax=Oesophagostomum dentatum TaxID=61180 RepID=A0A0B1RWP6_OESDE|nr:putative ribosomal protein S18 [Oesophagostomum dentatum]
MLLRTTFALHRFTRRMPILRVNAQRMLSTPQEPGSSSLKVSEGDPDAPVEIESNPYKKEDRKCLLCRTGIELDYKNARLLQQFVSTFSGRVYDRHITGLCDHQQKKLVETIALSRKAGYMPIFVKDPKYTKDPKLFDPLKPIRPHSFA